MLDCLGLRTIRLIAAGADSDSDADTGRAKNTDPKTWSNRNQKIEYKFKQANSSTPSLPVP